MRSIVVSLLVNVGDVIMMTSALDLIKKHFSQTRLIALARPEAAELLTNNPVVDEVIVYPYRSGSLFYGLKDVTGRLRAGRPEVFLSLDRRPRGALAAFLAGIKKRLGPDILFAGARPKFWTRLFFTRTVVMAPEECAGSLVEMFQLVVRRSLGVAGRGRITLPPVSPERARRAEGLLSVAGRRRPVIGLCVKTNDPGKTWPAAAFAALMGRLKAELGAFMYVIGGPGDRPYVDELLQSFDSAGVANLAGRTDLSDIPALAARSDLCITLDNGAAHLMGNSALPRLICLLLATTPKILIDSLPRARFFSLAPAGDPPDGGRMDEEVGLIFQAASDWLKEGAL